jgi:hypothetical protein
MKELASRIRWPWLWAAMGVGLMIQSNYRHVMGIAVGLFFSAFGVLCLWYRWQDLRNR